VNLASRVTAACRQRPNDSHLCKNQLDGILSAQQLLAKGEEILTLDGRSAAGVAENRRSRMLLWCSRALFLICVLVGLTGLGVLIGQVATGLLAGVLSVILIVVARYLLK
jgi:type VI protein secretion system component VasF